jgi:hypothetical protein
MSTPSLLNVPYRLKAGTLYSQIPETGLGDFAVTRSASNVATRINSLGFIETVADNVPRLDYPLGGAVNGCPALLVEPSAANGILNSQDTATSWTLGANLSGSYVDVIGVSGNNLTVAASGSSIGASAGRLVRFNNNVALASGSTYTISFLMRQTGAHTIGGYYAVITGGASGNLGSGFDVSGSFSSGSLFVYTGVTSRIRRVEQWGTNVFRCSETFTMTASGTLTEMSFGPTVSTTANTNPAVGLGIAFAAPQIELGAIPTSFIPTTTAAITRGADLIRKTGITSLIGQSEGTVYFEVEVTDEARNKWFCSLDGSATGYVQMWIDTSRQVNVSIVNGTTVMTTLISSALSVGYHKLAFAYNTATNGCIMYIDGVQNPVATRTVVAPGLPAFNNMSFGTYITSTVDTLKAHVRAGAVYPNRFSNTDLALLTA